MVGVFVGVVEHGGVFGPVSHTGILGLDATYVAAALSGLAALVGLARPRLAMWGYLLAIVGGIFGAGTVWEFPGLFIFLAIVTQFIKGRGIE
ncbi:MAG: hypothetical protein OWT28_04460 [Firmicutes bacterium]|nr:hypothetical protein [Bacillota bacterium]